MNTDNLFIVNDANFQKDVIDAAQPVIVDFWAEWCGPCKSLGPIFADVAKEYTGKVSFAKLDVDSNQDTPAKFGIRGIPALIVFKDGKPVGTKMGAMSKQELMDFIDSQI